MHVEAKEGGYSWEKMKIICQNILLLENVMDSFLPYHTGSEKCHFYFESNLLAVMEMHDTPEGSLGAIFSCRSRKNLYDKDISHNELAKSCGRSTTIYWVQATPFNKRWGTINIMAWVWFCVLFVINAAMLPPFDSLSQIDYVLEGDNAMFKHLVVNILKCPILQEFYVNGFLTTPY